MKKVNSFKRRALLMGAMLAVFSLSGCKQNPETAQPAQTFTVTFGAEGGIGGTLTAAVGEKKYTESPIQIGSGKIITFTAEPKTGFKVKQWIGTDDASSNTGNTSKLTVNGNASVSVEFESSVNPLKNYTITYHLDGGNNHADNPDTYNSETGTITLKPATKAGCTFDGWFDNSSLSGSAVTQITQGSSGNKEFWAKWTVNTYTVSYTVIDGTGGKLKVTGGTETALSASITVRHGSSVTFTADPEDGYKVERWTGVTAADGALTAELTVSANADVKVKFKEKNDEAEYEMIKATPPENGIAGKDPEYKIPSTGSSYGYKGVFVAGRTVKLSPYKIGKYEVSYKLWFKVKKWAEENGYVFANKGAEGSMGEEGAEPSKDLNMPVTKINWRDCIVWCNAYTQMKNGGDEAECVYYKKDKTALIKNAAEQGWGDAYICDTAVADITKKGFRLPTEAEWEFAARYQKDNSNGMAVNYGSDAAPVWLTKMDTASGADKPLPHEEIPVPEGETYETLREELTRVAVYRHFWDGSKWTSLIPPTAGTAGIGSKEANQLGLYDMTGNVWELCWDFFYVTVNGGSYTDPQGPVSGNRRAMRGGSWYSKTFACTVGVRDGNVPSLKSETAGFRPVCSLTE